MKRLFLAIFFLNIRICCISQNHVSRYESGVTLDLNSARNWPAVTGGNISDNGEYLYYHLSNVPAGSISIVIKSTNLSWEKTFHSCSAAAFTPDSRFLIYKSTTDSLFLVTLGTDNCTYLGKATIFKTLGDKKFPMVAFMNKRNGGAFSLSNLNSGATFEMNSVNDFFISSNNKAFLVALDTIKNGIATHVLKWIKLPEFRVKEVWSSAEELTENYSFDTACLQLVFLTKSSNEASTDYNLWYYNAEKNKSTCIQSSGSQNGDYKLCNQAPFFSKGGTKIFFGQVKKETSTNEAAPTKVEVWNYRDKQLKNVQIEEMKRVKTYTCVYNISDKTVKVIDTDGERILSIGNDYALTIHESGNRGIFEAYWNKEAKLSFQLVSLKYGDRDTLRDKVITYDGGISISPNWKWGVYFDFDKKRYVSIDLKTKTQRSITSSISTIWTKTVNAYSLPTLAGSLLWINEGKELLIPDNSDIWKVDPAAQLIPINLTNGYGKKHHIKFEVLNSDDELRAYNSGNSVLLLKGFNEETKEYYFFKKTIGAAGDPELLSKGPYVYGWWNGYGSYNSTPVKAKGAEIYLVIRMKADAAPNYFITRDFKTFTSVSDIQPQKSFNWYTTELHSWKSLDGSILQGILYKPQNFDSNKKYPVIFDYYERRSDELNMFISPKASDGRINIPLFVSAGYLVFVPDIHYKVGWPGLSAYQSVVSAASNLMKYKWVDKNRMGLQGHSFGGYETNYIITMTGLFAAACSASGFCDLISSYNSGARGGYSMFSSELGQKRLGVTPWQKPDLYIQNSPIYFADKIVTPLLLMNNKNDQVVPFSQGIEFFTALRRLNKKVWMLQYDEGGHELDGNDAEDFHKRMQQFFDYFLKDKPAPVWMTRGIDLRDNLINDGLKLEMQHKQLPPGLQ